MTKNKTAVSQGRQINSYQVKSHTSGIGGVGIEAPLSRVQGNLEQGVLSLWGKWEHSPHYMSRKQE